MPAVYRALEHVLVEVQLVPDLPQLAGMKLRSLEIDGVTFLSLRGDPHRGWGKLAKRSMDLALGSIALLAAGAGDVAASRRSSSSRAPVRSSTVSMRTGLAGQSFDMLSFAACGIDAEVKTALFGPVGMTTRCTPLGRFMRRWSLDELPQLFNVIWGNMSLVGRGLSGVCLSRSSAIKCRNYSQRHQVKAGITGWAQVNGWRGNTSLRRRVECDLYYISNWSPGSI